MPLRNMAPEPAGLAGEWLRNSALVDFNNKGEGVSIDGVDILALARDGAHRAFPCHGEVIEGGPCAEASHRRAIRATHVHCEPRDIP